MGSLGVKEMLDFLIIYFNMLHIFVVFPVLPKGLAHIVPPLIIPIISHEVKLSVFLFTEKSTDIEWIA